MARRSIPVVTEAEVMRLVSPGDARRVIEETYAEYGRARALLSKPPALLLPTGGAAGAPVFKIKGAHLPGRGVAGFRIIADRDLPDGEVTIDYCWVADAATGEVLGLVEEHPLHRLRTATTGIVAAKWLARADSRIVAIVGAGAIADELPRGLADAFSPASVRIASRRFETAEAFAARHCAVVPIVACRTIDEAVAGADIIIAVTSAREPVILPRHIGPGVTVCGLGGGHEIALEALHAADRFVVDDLAYAMTIGSVHGWHRAGMSAADLQGRLAADIGEIATGAKPGRTSPDESIVAVIQGMACCDLALSDLALRRATAEMTAAASAVLGGRPEAGR